MKLSTKFALVLLINLIGAVGGLIVLAWLAPLWVYALAAVIVCTIITFRCATGLQESLEIEKIQERSEKGGK